MLEAGGLWMVCWHFPQVFQGPEVTGSICNPYLTATLHPAAASMSYFSGCRHQPPAHCSFRLSGGTLDLGMHRVPEATAAGPWGCRSASLEGNGVGITDSDTVGSMRTMMLLSAAVWAVLG